MAPFDGFPRFVRKLSAKDDSFSLECFQRRVRLAGVIRFEQTPEHQSVRVSSRPRTIATRVCRFPIVTHCRNGNCRSSSASKRRKRRNSFRCCPVPTDMFVHGWRWNRLNNKSLRSLDRH